VPAGVSKKSGAFKATGTCSPASLRAASRGGILPAMNLQQLRRLDADAEAAIRRISIVKLTATILVVYAVTLAAMVLLMLVTG